ncbi:MAG: hypothetical protein LIP03_07085 [Bacteroidales bacterium]|nr:hypothetical protein [Bacteroidales bacterium]
MKKLTLILGLALLVPTASCGKKTYPVTTANENLSSLTKITDGRNAALDPNGGAEGEPLFYVVVESEDLSSLNFNKVSNVYRKDNPLAPSQTQVTSGKNYLRGPWFNADIDRVAFGGKLAGASTYDISMMPAYKGTAIYPITESVDASEMWPCISSDGKLIVYQRVTTSGKITKAEIWIKNLVTGESAILGGGAVPRFSPDAQQIAYLKFNSENQSQLWVMNSDGTNPRQLTDIKKGYVSDLSWSPDGNQIVFCAKRDNKKDFDLYILNVDGTNFHQITINESSDISPYWSKDNYIYFCSDRGSQSGKYQIWRFKAK